MTAPGTGLGAPAPDPSAGRSPKRIVLIVLGVVLVLACCCGPGVVAAVARLRENSGRPAAVQSGYPGRAGVLAALLVPRPAGAGSWQTRPDEETLNLSAAARFGGDPADWRPVLTSEGFELGVVRRWSLNDRIVDVTLFRFANEDGARRFYMVAASGFKQDGSWTDPIRVPTIADGVEFTQPSQDRAGYLDDLIIGYLGTLFIDIEVTRPDGPDRTAVQLMRDQVARLSSATRSG